MSHVLQVLSEGWSSFTGMTKEVFDRVVPAIKHPETGKVYVAPRGEDHNDIIAKHGELKSLGDLLSSGKIKSEKWNFNRDSGYYDPHTKEFHPRQFDATELMTPHQRFRKYGAESKFIEAESKPYHVPLSSLKPDPEFDMAGWDGKPAPFKPWHDPERSQAIRDKNAASVSHIRASIRSGNPLEPITVTKGYNILDGHHRYLAAKLEGHKTVPVIKVESKLSERWIDQPVTSVTDDGPASSLNANQSPQEMAKLMLANNKDKDKPTILRYMQYLLNHTTYKMSPEFRGKVKAAMRIIQGNVFFNGGLSRDES